MKVLIIDDNEAIQEILSDVLQQDGHEVFMASTVEKAVQSIRLNYPDVIFMERIVSGEDVFKVPVIIHESDPGIPLNIIFLKAIGDEQPSNQPFIKGNIDKPFTSADVLDALKIAVAKDVVVQDKPVVKKKGIFRKRTVVEPAFEEKEKQGIKAGEAFVVFEEEPNRIYRFISCFDPSKYDVLVVSTDKQKAVKQRFSYSDIDVLTLNTSLKGGTMDIAATGSASAYILKYIEEHDQPVVVFDDYNGIVEVNGLNRALVMIHQLIREGGEKAIVAISIDPSILTLKDRNIILADMRQYDL